MAAGILIRMIKFDQLRTRQEQRLVPALKSWNEAKGHLEKALALAEAREREFRELSEDVQRKLAALDVVIGMANEIGDEIPTERLLNAAESSPTLMLTEKGGGGVGVTDTAETSARVQITVPQSHGFGGLIRRSSRPLFSAHQRSKHGSLSIFQ